MSTHDRATRVAHEFQHELSEVLARGLKDPRITGFITVTGAKMPPDLKDITVYVSIHGDEATREQTLAGLRAAAATRPTCASPTTRAWPKATRSSGC